MLTNDTIKLLKWMGEKDKWMTQSQIKAEYKDFSDRSFKTITSKNLVDSRFAVGDSWAEYRISELGKVRLKENQDQKLAALREWINFTIPVISFIGGILLSDYAKSFFVWIIELISG